MKGVLFSQQGLFYKFLVIEFGSDNSFYFLPCQHDAEVGKRIKAKNSEHGSIQFDPSEVVSGCFPMRKISRHPSGYFHIKDVVGPGGRREIDGLKGPSFEQIKSSFIFLVACPQQINTMIKVDIPSENDLVIYLPDEIEPFTVQFAVWNKKVLPHQFASPDEMLGDNVVVMISKEYSYGLLLGLVKDPKNKPKYRNTFPEEVILHG